MQPRTWRSMPRSPPLRLPTTHGHAPTTCASRRRRWWTRPRTTGRRSLLREAGCHRGREPAGRLDHRVMTDTVEQFDGELGTRRAQAFGHGHDRDRIVDAPHDVERRRMRLDRARVARLVAAPFFDVAD